MPIRGRDTVLGLAVVLLIGAGLAAPFGIIGAAYGLLVEDNQART